MTTEHDAWRVELQAWAAAMRGAALTPETVRLRVYDLGRLRRWAAGRGPWELTLDDLEQFMGAHTWARETARGMRSSLRRFYAWGVGTERTATNPAAGLPKIAPERPRPRPAPRSGVLVALHDADRRTLLMLRLANELGLRRAEVAQVHSRDVFEDLAGWSLLVHGKGRRERVVPLPVDLAGALRRLPPGYAFPGACEGHLSPRWVGKVCARALPGETTMHQLRHLAASEWFRETRDLRVVQELLGHASLATTERYVAVDDDARRAAVSERAARWAG